MAGGSDEVEECVDTIVSEARVSLDTRFLGKNIVVLPFKVTNNFAKCRFVVNLITEAGSVDDSQGDTSALLIQFKFYLFVSLQVISCCMLSHIPTVTGLILTPSSRCALAASSASLGWRTRFPHRVLTKVVRPVVPSALAYGNKARVTHRFRLHRKP